LTNTIANDGFMYAEFWLVGPLK